MYKVAICDDERRALDSLCTQISKVAGDKVDDVLAFDNVTDLAVMLESETTQDVGLLFLDIEIGNVNGIEVARARLKAKPDLQIIFISGHDDYYLDVYDVDHLFFLKKPITDEALAKALHRAEEKLPLRNKVFHIKTRQNSFNIRLDDIMYLEKDLRKIRIHTTDETYSFYGKFDEIMPLLGNQFIRCHNSFIVNISKIKHMEPSAFTMVGDRDIPISRSRA